MYAMEAYFVIIMSTKKYNVCELAMIRLTWINSCGTFWLLIASVNRWCCLTLIISVCDEAWLMGWGMRDALIVFICILPVHVDNWNKYLASPLWLSQWLKCNSAPVSFGVLHDAAWPCTCWLQYYSHTTIKTRSAKSRHHDPCST